MSGITRTTLIVGAALSLVAGGAVLGGELGVFSDEGTDLRFSLSFPEDVSPEARDGRLLVLLSSDSTAEPRTLVGPAPDGPGQLFGTNVSDLAPGESAVLGGEAFGHPVERLADLPAGEYYVQGFLNRYETFERSDGHTVQLPPDRGEGQVWREKPGNLYSEPRQIRVDPGEGGTVELVLDQEIPPPEEPQEETRHLKHITIQSDLLTEFWGRPMELGAWVLLPGGWHERPNARYPLMIYQGHFHKDFYAPVRWRTRPPADSLPAVDTAWLNENCPNGHSEGCAEHGYERFQQQTAYDLYRQWTGPDFPRFILITIQHANPYFDDSYAVNSANVGPYGDAIVEELIPRIEEEFRGIGEGWARVQYGGSTGGWESLAQQIFYPEEFNGAWSACPDPVDFRSYELINIYEDENAYRDAGPFGSVARPGHRDYLGRVDYMVEDENHYELALGDNARSGGQWDIWQAVFGPVADDGYPKPIWNKRTGRIDPDVAEHWRENYDLRHILERDWEELGPKLEGKLHIYVGEMDNYYLNNAVYRMEQFLESTDDPYYGGEVEYGARDEHCWSGDHEHENWRSRLTYVQRLAPQMEREIVERSPPGADTTSWRY